MNVVRTKWRLCPERRIAASFDPQLPPCRKSIGTFLASAGVARLAFHF